MDNNYKLRSLRYTFSLSDDKMIELFALAGHEVNRTEVCSWLKKDDDEGYKPIYDQHLAAFLNGLIISKRGKKDGQLPVAEKKLNNNMVLRKLKIALNLNVEDILEIISLTNFRFSKHELSALFRNPKQQQYQVCKDQVLRNFLQGLTIKYREVAPK